MKRNDGLETMQQEKVSEEDKIRSLRKERALLLHQIHKDQQRLDQLDYQLYQMMKKDSRRK